MESKKIRPGTWFLHKRILDPRDMSRNIWCFVTSVRNGVVHYRTYHGDSPCGDHTPKTHRDLFGNLQYFPIEQADRWIKKIG